MKMIFTFLGLVLLLLGTSSAYATAQDADRVTYEGKEYKLFSNPLEDLYSDGEARRPNFMILPNVTSSGNWRGYRAYWNISGDRLYLTSIDSWICDPSIRTKSHCRKATLADIAGTTDDDPRIFASWFSGELRIPDGKELMYVHAGYASVYERDILFWVNAGNVGRPRMVDNTKTARPSPDERVSQELERLRSRESRDSEPALPNGADMSAPIVAGKGWTKVLLGNKRQIVESVLGKGEGEERHKGLDDVYFREYPESGIQVSYRHATNTVQAIFFYHKASRYERLNTLPFKTDKNIDWTSSVADVLKAYGKPAADYQNDPGTRPWRRIEFKGIDFRFEGDKMVRISVIP